MQQGSTLSREDFIGRRIVGIACRGWTEADLDYDHTYLTLDTGVTFCPPLADFSPIAAEVDPGAIRVSQDFSSRISTSPIVAMYAIQQDDGWIDPLSLLIELADGRVLTHSTVEPHGTGLAGLRVYPKGQFDLSRYSDYWALDRSDVLHEDN